MAVRGQVVALARLMCKTFVSSNVAKLKLSLRVPGQLLPAEKFGGAWSSYADSKTWLHQLCDRGETYANQSARMNRYSKFLFLIIIFLYAVEVFSNGFQFRGC